LKTHGKALNQVNDVCNFGRDSSVVQQHYELDYWSYQQGHATSPLMALVMTDVDLSATGASLA